MCSPGVVVGKGAARHTTNEVPAVLQALLDPESEVKGGGY